MDNNTNNTNTPETLINDLFNGFLDDGGSPKITEFKRYLDRLVGKQIKPLCGGRGASSGTAPGGDWRTDLKARFSGRGAKWQRVSLEEVTPTLDAFGFDCDEYRQWIQQQGFAWIRFSGPRLHKGQQCAAFEVRTEGSTYDHPKQLHYIAIHDLDDTIEQLPGTPHSMKLEFIDPNFVAPTQDDVEEDAEATDEVVTTEVDADEVDALLNEDDDDDAGKNDLFAPMS